MNQEAFNATAVVLIFASLLITIFYATTKCEMPDKAHPTKPVHDFSTA